MLYRKKKRLIDVKKRPYKGWAVAEKFCALEMPQELWNAFTHIKWRPRLFHCTWNLMGWKGTTQRTRSHRVFHTSRCPLPSPGI